MARVFISHAGEDLAVAARLRAWLVEDGHEVFLDRDLTDGIAAGDEWEERLHERLRWADATVCVITKSYVDSVWCTSEVAITRSRGGRLVPVRAEPGVTHPLLKSVQYTDLTRDPYAVRTALTTALRRVDQTHGVGWTDDRSPFPGLRSFDEDLHRVFFGRDADVAQLASRLRSPAERAGNALLLVVGPSGCGKSSVLRAGLLPAMAGEPDWWTLPAFTPGVDPTAALVRELAAAAKALGVDWELGEVRTRMVELVDTILLAAPGARRKRLLVSVDQFEELLVQTPPAERATFAGLLRTLLGGSVNVVATLRPEFLDRVLADPDLSALAMTTHMLRPMRRETLRAVIEGPARLAGITVAEELVSLLVDDTGSGDALPLLAFALEQLAEGVGRGGQLSMARYEALGGVRGALVRQADAALLDATAASGRDREAVLASLLRVVTVDERQRPTRWHVRRADLSGPESAELDAFIARRLLTVEGRDAMIGASHEAFFTAWPSLDAAIRDAGDALRSRAQAEDAAAEWDANERRAGKLWERGQLAAALASMDVTVRRRQVHAGKVYVSPLGKDFLYASVRRERFRRRRLVVTLSVLLVLAMGAAVVAYVQQRSAQEQERAALDQALLVTARGLVDKAESTLDNEPRTALMLNVAAHRIYPNAETFASLQQAVSTTPYAGELSGVDYGVSDIAFAPDGRRLAVGFYSGAIILWDFRDPLRPRMLGKPFISFAAGVTMVFSPDGGRLVTAGSNGGVTVWDLTDPEHPYALGTPVPGEKNPGGGAWLSPDGTVLATAPSEGPGLQLWDLTDPDRVRPLGTPLVNHPKQISGVAFSPHGNTIATGSTHDVPVTLWDITQRAAPRLLSTITPEGVIDSLSFAPDGRQLAASGTFTATRLWDVSDPTSPRLVGEPIGASLAPVFFSPNGTTLATTGNDETGLRLWDVTYPDWPNLTEQLLTGESELTVAFSPDGGVLASGNEGGVVTLWNLDRQNSPRVLGPPAVGYPATEYHKEVYALDLTEDATMFATGGRDGSAELWDVAGPAHRRQLGVPSTEDGHGVNAVGFAPNGELLIAGGNGRAVLWDLRDPTRPRRLPRELTGFDGWVRSILFSPDGTTVIVGSDRKTVVWDVRDPGRPRRGTTVFEEEQVIGLWRVRDGRVLALVRGSGEYTNPSAIANPTTTTTGASGDAAASGGSSSPDEGPGDPNGSRLWDITDPGHHRQLGPGLTGHTDMVMTAAMSPDGKLLSVSDEHGTVIFWDTSDPTRPRRIGDPWTPHGTTSSVTLAFPPQAGIMATGGIEGTVYLWDIGEPVRPRRLGPGLTDNLDATSDLEFSADGRTLAAARSQGDVVLWNVTPLHDLRRDPAALACEITDRGLDRDEWTRAVPGLPYQDTCT